MPILNFCSYKGGLPTCSLNPLHFFLSRNNLPTSGVPSSHPPFNSSTKKLPRIRQQLVLLFPFSQIRPVMEPRSRSWALGLSIVGLFGLLFSAGFVQQVAADDVADYGTVIGIVSAHTSYPGLSPAPAPVPASSHPS